MRNDKVEKKFAIDKQRETFNKKTNNNLLHFLMHFITFFKWPILKAFYEEGVAEVATSWCLRMKQCCLQNETVTSRNVLHET
jgi:hypothetical protein